MNANHLALISVASYALAYVTTWSGAEAGRIARLLGSAPNDPSESQARALSDRTTTRCPHCRRPGISHRRWCPRRSL